MQIDIPIAAQQRLADQAAAHGFSSVDDFVVRLLSNVSALSDQAVVFAPLEGERLEQSEAILRRGEEDLAAGRVRTMRDGLLDLGAARGLTPGG